MPVKSKSGRVFELPTDEEDIIITLGIASDPDTYELSDDEFAELSVVDHPLADANKDKVTIRLSREVMDYFRETGAGWQTRIDEALLEYVTTHR